jgi:hypothetical protein
MSRRSARCLGDGTQLGDPLARALRPEHGLGIKGIERLRELAVPRWGRVVTDLPLSALVPEFGQVTVA